MSQPTVAFVTGLTCLKCRVEYGMEGTESVCESCARGPDQGEPGVLDVRYDYAAAGDALRAGLAGGRGARDLFRYWPLLPLPDQSDPQSRPAFLGAGDTPLVEAPSIARRLGLESFWIKDETANPSGCLKDRATAIAIALAAARGMRELCCASAGNAALSLARFCAEARFACHVFVPSGIDPARLARLRALGADVRVSAGDYDQAYDEAVLACRREGWYSRSCAWNPFLVEGKKTVSFEIAEQRGWQVPDLVAAPVGDGCTLGAIGKGFRELAQVGLTRTIPRLIGVQAEAVQPLVGRWLGVAPAPTERATAASSIAVRRPRNSLRVLDEVRQSGGILIAVSDRETARAQELLLEEAGIRAEFSSATALAGLLRLAASGSLGAGSGCLVVTGGART